MSEIRATLRTDAALHEVVRDEDGQDWAVTTYFDPDHIKTRITPDEAKERIETYRRCGGSSISDREGVRCG